MQESIDQIDRKHAQHRGQSELRIGRIMTSHVLGRRHVTLAVEQFLCESIAVPMEPTMEFKCPHCASTLHPKPEWAGRRGKCKVCFVPIVIPSVIDGPSGTPLLRAASSAKQTCDDEDEVLLTLAEPQRVPSVPLATRQNENPFAFLPEASGNNSSAAHNRQKNTVTTALPKSDLPAVMIICGKVLKWFHAVSMLLVAVGWMVGVLIAYTNAPQAARIEPLAVAGTFVVAGLAIWLHWVLYMIAQGIVAGHKAAVYGLIFFGVVFLYGTVVLLTSDSSQLIGFISTRHVGIHNAMYLAFLYCPAIISACTVWRKLT